MGSRRNLAGEIVAREDISIRLLTPADSARKVDVDAEFVLESGNTIRANVSLDDPAWDSGIHDFRNAEQVVFDILGSTGQREHPAGAERVILLRIDARAICEEFFTAWDRLGEQKSPPCPGCEVRGRVQMEEIG